ncbi:glycosyltransferase [Burkholderia multivorans]|uniref:glycosyltransferase n=1 Tax=Burkholderia ubonensis TaxID=101571 RepID=UPI000F71BEB3|nr:glycosyltransferase [Burkholderia ubonensis]AYZ67546.1 glycosyltransferase [Burkholderia multivorans]VWB64516.1 glycosyltransferase [Burkholderia ubonensis]
MTNPLVSVIMPSYNHGLFVADAIGSVLSQSFGDYEFLISDDGSKDDTVEVIERFDDPRIKLKANRINRGACVVHNELLDMARGKYVALINSDDMWKPGKLALQVNYMESHPEIGGHFGRASYIDKDGGALSKSDVAFGRVFDQSNRSQGDWLRFFFDIGNCLCHPTSLIRRECYVELGGYNNRMRQLPDYDMWVRFIKSYKIHIDDAPLIDFRVLPGENASAHTSENSIRTINEHYLIAAHFFDNVGSNLFVNAFRDRIKCSEGASREVMEIEKTLQYFVHNQWLGGVYKAVGLRRLFDHLCDERQREILERDYGIDDREFQKMSAGFDAFRPNIPLATVPDHLIKDEFVKRVKYRIVRRFARRR